MTALERPALRPLVDELSRRLADGQVPATIALPDACRPAVADLLGLDRIPPAGGRLRVARLLEALSLADLDDLRRAVESVAGPLPEPATERRVERERRERLWAWLAGEAARICLGRPLDDWVTAQRARGARGGLDHRRRELEHALAVLRRLPADGLALASLAADETTGPHGLDHGRSLAITVLDAVAVATDRPRPSNAEDSRLLWESVEVAPDPLSSTVSVLGLAGDDSPLGVWLDAARRVSEPVVLTLANLRRWPRPPGPVGQAIYVLENPSLMAEAAARRWNGPPLVCSSGRPSVAVVTLLRQLAASGAPIYQHADFDSPGLAITTWLHERAGTQPWRMTAADYLAAAPNREATLDAVPPTPWDPALGEAMAERGVAVYEEDVRLTLLADVQSATDQSAYEDAPPEGAVTASVV